MNKYIILLSLLFSNCLFQSNEKSVDWNYLSGFWKFEDSGKVYIAFFKKCNRPADCNPNDGNQSLYLYPENKDTSSMLYNGSTFNLNQSNQLTYKQCGGECDYYANITSASSTILVVDYKDVSELLIGRKIITYNKVYDITIDSTTFPSKIYVK